MVEAGPGPTVGKRAYLRGKGALELLKGKKTTAGGGKNQWEDRRSNHEIKKGPSLKVCPSSSEKETPEKGKRQLRRVAKASSSRATKKEKQEAGKGKKLSFKSSQLEGEQ